MENQHFPTTCHQPVTNRLDELLKVTSRLEEQSKSTIERLVKIENKFDKTHDENAKCKTTISHLVAFANNNKDTKDKIGQIEHKVQIIEKRHQDGKSRWAKILESTYQICLIILTVVLPILLAKIGFAQ